MLIGVLSLVSIVVIGYEALHSSLFSVRHVTILGNSETTDQQVLVASGLDKHPALINLSITADEAAIERLPWINQADIRRNWPDSATVVVTERNPVATYRVGKVRFGLVDETGRLLAIVRRAPHGLVPIRVGSLTIRPGASLPAVDAALARVAAAVPVSILTSLLRVEAAPTGVVMVLRSGATAELGQASDLAAKMTALATMLATPSVVLGPHSSIDLRVPDAPVVTSS
jgi:cell division protein FtsQ